jgi:hypothetical protein
MTNTFSPNLVSPTGSEPAWPAAAEGDVGVTVDDTATRAVAKNTENAPSETTSDGLVRKIQDLGARIARCESEEVALTIEKGQLLAKLKTRAKRDWGERLKTLKMAPRVASRLKKIGTWAKTIGLNESELLDSLPPDPLKLEWIAKLDLIQSRKLVKEINCREASRSAVVKAVKRILGHEEPAAESDPALKTIKRLIERLITALHSLSTPPATEVHERLCQALTAAMKDLSD